MQLISPLNPTAFVTAIQACHCHRFTQSHYFPSSRKSPLPLFCEAIQACWSYVDHVVCKGGGCAPQPRAFFKCHPRLMFSSFSSFCNISFHIWSASSSFSIIFILILFHIFLKHTFMIFCSIFITFYQFHFFHYASSFVIIVHQFSSFF